MDLVDIARELGERTGRLRFKDPVRYVYNPLEYAWPAHHAYLRAWARGRRDVLLLGMNPGPWGMAQTGVPFGDVEMVREWLGVEADIGRPRREHPKRPVRGFDCERKEISGRRLWGWARDRFGTPARFHERFLVLNYCPLSFMEASGRNRTPDRLTTRERERLGAICDRALQRSVERLRPRWVVGVGRWAEARARGALAGRFDGVIGSIPHPSPASPLANRAWPAQADRALDELGVRLR